MRPLFFAPLFSHREERWKKNFVVPFAVLGFTRRVLGVVSILFFSAFSLLVTGEKNRARVRIDSTGNKKEKIREEFLSTSRRITSNFWHSFIIFKMSLKTVEWWKKLSQSADGLGWVLRTEPSAQLPEFEFHSASKTLVVRGNIHWFSSREGTIAVVMDEPNCSQDKLILKDVCDIMEKTGLGFRALSIRLPPEYRTVKTRRLPAEQFVRLCRVLNTNSDERPLFSARKFGSVNVSGFVWSYEDRGGESFLPLDFNIELSFVENPWAKSRSKGPHQANSLAKMFPRAKVRIEVQR